ncbi:unnamed protein product [Oikopleura dioica]|uniref:Uncharacterized protein n=1 Tax=Oikopleura dioica TaxID=34765 RepID=E4Z4G6_OIKDI|nr:unnamed protein product [Oikopleura dioica]
MELNSEIVVIFEKWDVLAAHGSQKQSPKLLLNADSMKVYVTLQRVNKNHLIWRCCDRRCSGSHEIKPHNCLFETIKTGHRYSIKWSSDRNDSPGKEKKLFFFKELSY